MKIDVTLDQSMSEIVSDEIAKAEKAVTKGITATSNKIKTAWRDDVLSALGQRLSQAIRSKVYPEGETSLEAAALVYARPGKKPNTGAARIIAGHEAGSVIRGYQGLWLAIPTEEAGTGPRGKKMTPLDWERRTGNRLHFVYRPSGASFLVGQVKATKKGRLGKGGRTKKGAYRAGTFSSVIFFLVPQVKLLKRLDLMSKADRLLLGLPQSIVQNWPG